MRLQLGVGVSLSSDQRAPYWAADSESSFCIWPPMGEPGAAEAPNSVFSSSRGLQISSRSVLRLSTAAAGPASRTPAAMVLRIRRMARQQCQPLSQPQVSLIHQMGSHIGAGGRSAVWPWWSSWRWEVRLSWWGCVGRYIQVASHLVPPGAGSRQMRSLPLSRRKIGIKALACSAARHKSSIISN